MPHQPTVELHHAFMWDCHSCGRENFVRSVPMTPAMVDNLIVAGEVEGSDTEAVQEHPGDFWMAPNRVICGHCGAAFGVEAD